MEALMIYGGNNILDMTIKKYYEKYPDRFKGAGTSSGFKYEYITMEPPVILLGNSSRAASHNAIIKMKNVMIKIQSQTFAGVSLNENVAMKATGKLKIVGGKLSFDSLRVSIENPSEINVVIAEVINARIVPALTRSLQNISLPQLEKVFGVDLSVRIRSGNVIAGPALEVGARTGGRSGITSADCPTTTDLSTLDSGSVSNALILGTVSSGAINTLIKKIIGTTSLQFRKIAEGLLGFAGGIRGTIKATSPIVTIKNGRGNVSSKIFITLHAGIRNPVTGWTWVPIAVPHIEVSITNRLVLNGRRAYIQLTAVSRIRIDLDWPAILGPVESVVENLINGVASHFKGIFSAKLAGIEQKLFDLPVKIPGTALNATLNFDRTGGFSYYRNSIKARIRITD